MGEETTATESVLNNNNSQETRTELHESLISDFSEYYPGLDVLPVRAKAIAEEITEHQRDLWDMYTNGELQDIPGLNITIREVLQKEIENIYPDEPDISITPGDGGIITSKDYDEWITKEMFEQEIRHLTNIVNSQDEDGVARDRALTLIDRLTKHRKDKITTTRRILSHSRYLTHSTRHTVEILKQGALMSYSQQKEITGKGIFNTAGSFKREGQERDQVVFSLDSFAFRYAGLGTAFNKEWYSSKHKSPATRGVFLLPALPLLIDENISFFSADGLHIFQGVNSTGISTSPAKGTRLITTQGEYSKLHSPTRTIESDNPFDSSNVQVIPNSVLSEEEKETLTELTIKDDYGEQIFLDPDDIEKPSYTSPACKNKIDNYFSTATDEELIKKVRNTAFVVPTGEFGDTPGVGAKSFKRKVVLT